jgi:HJR/Mrr/RecB family endonuclease
MALHPALGEASYDSVLNEMLKLKRGLSRNIVVPTAFTEGDFRKMSSSILRGPAPDGVLDRIDVMGWREFEDWTAEQFSRAGYQAHVTPRTGDGGADIILRPPSGKSVRPVICQCKHRALGGQTDETAVRDLVRARSGYGASYPWLQDPILCAVTNGEASLPVRRLSAENAVLVVDRARISDLFAIAKEMLRGAPPVE